MNEKFHVIKDENLGGVLREFVEVDRKEPGSVEFEGYYDEGRDDKIVDWFVGAYKTLEPTDIVHIGGKRYRMVERRARIGEKVLITVDSKIKGVAFTVSGFDSDGDLVFKESDHYYAKHGDYVVLETVEQSPSVLDMIANLSEQIVKLNRRIDRLADANEQAIATVARDVERVDADLIKLRKEFEGSKDVNLTLSSELVAKLIEKGLNG